jgi:pimeloyl-ACP methyl ester carboxylesterase
MGFHYAVVPALFMLAAALIAWLAIRRIISLRAKRLPKSRKTSERIVLSLVAVVALLFAISCGISVVAFGRFRHAPPGAIYQVNGHGMRIDCMGTGSPTIVLEAGMGNDGLIWGGVQPELAKTTRVCSYDRSGYGWSDAETPPRDADRIATELHGLLAGIYIRDYATRYPADVAGLIFVDGSTPLQEKDPAFQAHLPMQLPGTTQIFLMKAKFGAGISRWLGACSDEPDWPDRRAAYLMNEDRCFPGIGASLGEFGSMDRSGEETVHSGPYGTLPILIFSSDDEKAREQKLPEDVVEAWSRMQQNLLKLSTRSRRIIAADSGHPIQLDRPDLIETEVPVFIEQIRGTAPAPTNYGSTVTE